MKIFVRGTVIELYSITFLRSVSEFFGQGIDSLSFTYAIDYFEVKKTVLTVFRNS